jgi:hypothetical protein
VKKFKYLRHKEIKSKLYFAIFCLHVCYLKCAKSKEGTGIWMILWDSTTMIKSRGLDGGTCSIHGTDNKCILSFGGKPKEDHLNDFGVEGRAILNWILYKQYMRMWTGLIWL